MAYLADLGNVLERRVLEVDPGAEGTGNCDIHVLVDRGRDHEALVAAVVGGQIGAASAEGDPQRAAYDDHVPDSSNGSRRSSSQSLSRRNASVRRTPCSMLSCGCHPSARIRVVSRKMNGLSPTQPRSPPV